MQLTYYFVAVISAVAVYAQAPDPSINTPSAVQQCLPVQLTFSGSSPPFIVTVVPSGQAGAAPLDTVGTTSSNVITWTPKLGEGTNVNLLVRDSLGRTNPSGTFSILAGNTDCVNGAGASSAAASTTGAAASGSAAATSKAASGSAAVASATAASGASALKPAFAGLFGLIGAAALL